MNPCLYFHNMRRMGRMGRMGRTEPISPLSPIRPIGRPAKRKSEITPSCLLTPHRRKLFERTVLIAVVEIGPNQTIRLTKWQRTDQNPIYQTKDCRVGTDAECERGDCDHRKAGSFQQHARAVTQILEKGVHDLSATNGTNRTDRTYRSHLSHSSHSSYSYRNATIGSTLDARRAGMKQAISATIVSSAAATPKVHGSLGFTRKSMLLRLSRYRVNTKPPAMPSPTPINVNVIPCLKIMASILPRFAPSAMRMPISCVRRDTEYASTP